ncbi:hypothetical protein N9064_00600 [bacterium]|nr:hypothetical protein [bacterium]
MTKKQIKEKVTECELNIEKQYSKIDELQKTCRHYGVEFRYNGDSGYDYEWYSKEYYCPTCGKRWSCDSVDDPRGYKGVIKNEKEVKKFKRKN